MATGSSNWFTLANSHTCAHRRTLQCALLEASSALLVYDQCTCRQSAENERKSARVTKMVPMYS